MAGEGFYRNFDDGGVSPVFSGSARWSEVRQGPWRSASPEGLVARSRLGHEEEGVTVCAALGGGVGGLLRSTARVRRGEARSARLG